MLRVKDVPLAQQTPPKTLDIPPSFSLYLVVSPSTRLSAA